MGDSITIEDILKFQEILDKQDVPNHIQDALTYGVGLTKVGVVQTKEEKTMDLLLNPIQEKKLNFNKVWFGLVKPEGAALLPGGTA
jgi:hypothetical protein